MRRRTLLRTGAFGLASSAIASPAIAQSSTVNWRLQAGFPKSLDVLYGGAETIARHVSELTDGRFKIQVFAPGEIVGSFQIFDAVGNNTVDAGITALYYYIGKDPTLALGSAVPFGLNQRQQFSWLFDGGGNQLVETLLAPYNLVGLPAGGTGAQMGGFFRRELNSLADFRGLKFRIGGLGGQVLAKLGVVPQQIAPGDVYPALERGTLDAAEFIGPYDDEKLGLAKIAKYYYVPGWWEGGVSGHLLINKEKWEALPKSFQRALTVATQALCCEQIAQYDARNAAALRRILSQGAELRTFPRDSIEAAYKASFELYAEMGQTHPNWNKVYEPWLAFRQEALTWFRVSEATYDGFVNLMGNRR
jgi:TRAP-type mannitol/chloroaromatic compound transport system substrate-binding protein